jgi:hypothetical protein
MYFRNGNRLPIAVPSFHEQGPKTDDLLSRDSHGLYVYKVSFGTPPSGICPLAMIDVSVTRNVIVDPYHIRLAYMIREPENLVFG